MHQAVFSFDRPDELEYRCLHNKGPGKTPGRPTTALRCADATVGLYARLIVTVLRQRTLVGGLLDALHILLQ